MCPQTVYKGYELQNTGSNSDTWGTVLNDSVIDPVDSNMGGVLTVPGTNGSATLTATEARNCLFRVTGTVTTSYTLFSVPQGIFFVENLTTGGGSVFPSNGVVAGTVPTGTRAACFNDTANGVRVFSLVNITNPDELPTGTQMLFTSAAVPTGWTLVSSLNDYGLRVVSSTGAATGGSVAYSTLFGRTATDSFTLTDCPAHSHDINSIGTSGTSGGASGTAHWNHRTNSAGSATAFTDNVTGGNGGHTHGLDMRVLSVTTIIGARAV